MWNLSLSGHMQSGHVNSQINVFHDLIRQIWDKNNWVSVHLQASAEYCSCLLLCTDDSFLRAAHKFKLWFEPQYHMSIFSIFNVIKTNWQGLISDCKRATFLQRLKYHIILNKCHADTYLYEVSLQFLVINLTGKVTSLYNKY